MPPFAQRVMDRLWQAATDWYAVLPPTDTNYCIDTRLWEGLAQDAKPEYLREPAELGVRIVPIAKDRQVFVNRDSE